MSFKSYLLNQLGHRDVDQEFEKLYNISFKLQQYFDFNHERKTLLNRIKPYTHVNYQRLRSLFDIAEKVSNQKISGSFVEAGVWRGGCAGILSYVAKKHQYQNDLYFFDSFMGLPEPTVQDGHDAIMFAKGKKDGKLNTIKKVSAESDYLKTLLFKNLKIDPRRVKIIPGWFQDTLKLAKNKPAKIAILRLDGDWYESTKVVLEKLYDRVVPGGYIVIDDYYYWDGCKKAVDEFVTSRKLKVIMHRDDLSGAFFTKPV